MMPSLGGGEWDESFELDAAGGRGRGARRLLTRMPIAPGARTRYVAREPFLEPFSAVLLRAGALLRGRDRLPGRGRRPLGLRDRGARCPHLADRVRARFAAGRHRRDRRLLGRLGLPQPSLRPVRRGLGGGELAPAVLAVGAGLRAVVPARGVLRLGARDLALGAVVLLLAGRQGPAGGLEPSRSASWAAARARATASSRDGFPVAAARARAGAGFVGGFGAAETGSRTTRRSAGSHRTRRARADR